MTETTQRENLGEALHSALRKLCDSKPTSLAWNLIHVLPGEIWGSYLDHVHARLKDAPADRRALVLRKASLDWDYSGTPAKATLHCTFEMFDEIDWTAYAGYLDSVYGEAS